jgi:hypothetical protein
VERQQARELGGRCSGGSPSDPALAHLLKVKGLTDPEIDEVFELSRWAWVELNYRPHAYQAA